MMKKRHYSSQDGKELKMALRESYARVVENPNSSCSDISSSAGSCMKAANYEKVARKIGYSQTELQAVPPGSNLGLGCGNPIAFASLKVGERVLDLGSGAGIDCFLASHIVGPAGSVIGVDMTPEMVRRAKENAKYHLLKGGYANVQFREGEIESLPVESCSVDTVISNCVINLVPDKELAFQEAFRVLRPGGRLVVSDIVLNRSLPDFVLKSIEAQVGCVSGGAKRDRYLDALRSAGFCEVRVIGEFSMPIDCMVNDPSGWAISLSMKNNPEEAEEMKNLDRSISSIMVRASKPRFDQRGSIVR